MFLEHHIIIIFVGSCDTEDWSNDAVNSASIINYTSIYIHIENRCFKL